MTLKLFISVLSYIKIHFSIKGLLLKLFNFYLLECKINNLNFCCDTDINECLNKIICENGECTNLEGSFKCSCNEGYQHSMDGPNMCLGKFIVFTINKDT